MKTIDKLKIEHTSKESLILEVARIVKERCPNIRVEINGLWVWLSNTEKEDKEIYKDLGFTWLTKKKQWAYIGKRSFGKGNASQDEIRQKYGSLVF